MIGWKAKYGYFKQNPPGQFNISTIEFLDDSFFTIATGYNEGLVPFYQNGVTGQGVDTQNAQEGYSLLDAIFGGVNSNYLYGISGEYTYLTIAQTAIPSLFAPCPNLYSYLVDGQKYVSVATYIPSLNLIITTSTGSPISSDYYVGDESGEVFTRSFSGRQNFSVNGVNQDYSCMALKHYNSIEDLQNIENVTFFFAVTNTGYLRKVQFHSMPNADTTRLLSLFNKEPEFINNIPPDNPYEPGGPSGPTDPGLPPGTFDNESDPIPDSPLPTLSAANTGFTRIYNPTLSQVQALARYLWTDPDVIQTIWNHIKQFFEDPMEAIIGFNLVPVPVPDGGTESFALMYIDTGVSMTVAANQFVDLDCGTVELKRYYGSALDQSPYTKVSCFLPYIGTVNLNTDEVMGTTLQVKYRVDIVSGSCVAKVFVDGNCLYQYSGHCAITIPISSADFSSYVSAAISVGKLAAAAITAGAGAAMAAGVAEASQQTNQVVTTTQVTNTARNPSTGRQITTGTTTTVQTRESPADQSSTQASFSGLSPQNVANTVGSIMSSKPHIEHSGSFSGNSGYLGVRRPFLIIERPNMCMPSNYQALNGFPAMITMELSTCKGFTRVQQVQLTGMGRATNPEQAEILELLKLGVIL